MDSLREAMYAEAAGIPPLGDIDRAIHDVSVSRRRWAGIGIAATMLVLLVALIGLPWRPVAVEPAQPQPYPTTALQQAVIAWGSNENDLTNVPVEVRSGVSAIAVGQEHALAVKDGQVIAWGSRAPTSPQRPPVPADAESGVTAIAPGRLHSLALKDGRVIGWGGNLDGQVTVPVEAQAGVTAIAAGAFHSLAVKDGRVIAWGYNGSGENNVPAEAQSGVTAVAAGENLSLALKGGRVIAWGEGVANPVPAEAQSGVTAIAAGDFHALALKDGRVIAWGGGNLFGEATVPAEAQSGVTAIAAGTHHSLALKDGQVIAWGNNETGQATVPVEAQSGVTAIAAGSVSLAVRDLVGSGQQGTSTAVPKTPAPPDTATAAAESSFAAAIAAAGDLTKPTAEEVALVSDPSRYQWDDSTPQVSAAGAFAALRECGPSPATLALTGNPPVCQIGWAYQTGSVDGAEVHRGWLGAAEEPEVFPLDDRYFVAIESSPGLPRPPTAWLIDSATGGHAGLTWRDEPTTVNSRAQALVVSGGPWSVPRMVRRQAVPDLHQELFLPRVVDGRDGTIRPLAVPDNALADLPVTHNAGGRIWIGTTPDGDKLGLAYSDDGGGTWTEVALPAQVPGSVGELEASAADGDLLVSIAADGDRIAVTDAWSYDPTREVHVSTDAGQSWSTVPVANHPPSGNGAHLYVLADTQLLLVQSADPYAIQLLASTASDWTKLEGDERATEVTKGKYVDVNREGMVSMYYPVEGFDRGEIGGQPDAPPIRHHFSTDLTNWRALEAQDD